MPPCENKLPTKLPTALNGDSIVLTTCSMSCQPALISLNASRNGQVIALKMLFATCSIPCHTSTIPPTTSWNTPVITDHASLYGKIRICASVPHAPLIHSHTDFAADSIPLSASIPHFFTDFQCSTSSTK